MTLGSVIGGAAVIAWSQVHTVLEFYGVFAVIGIASAMVLYEPAFAIVVARFPLARRSNALLTVTIVAGFASSIFLPAAGLLNAHLGWRHAVLTLGIVLIGVTVPLHALNIPAGPAASSTRSESNSPTRMALADRGFWLQLVGFTVQGAALAVVSVHLITYLVRLGHSPAGASTIAGLLGVLSVAGRLVTSALTAATRSP
jgi:hypothetical protein